MVWPTLLVPLLFQISKNYSGNYSDHSVKETQKGNGAGRRASDPTLCSLTGVEKEIWGWKIEGLSANIKNDGS